MTTRRPTHITPFPHYVLDADRRVVETFDLFEWARFLEDYERRKVGDTKTKSHRVSTVFIGLDHRFGGKGPPVVFETMTFDKRGKIKLLFGHPAHVHEEADIDGVFGRWCSWDDAVAGHNSIVRRVRAWEKEHAHRPVRS